MTINEITEDAILKLGSFTCAEAIKNVSDLLSRYPYDNYQITNSIERIVDAAIKRLRRSGKICIIHSTSKAKYKNTNKYFPQENKMNQINYKYNTSKEENLVINIPEGYELKEVNPRIPKVGDIILWWYDISNDFDVSDYVKEDKYLIKNHPVLGKKRFILKKKEIKKEFNPKIGDTVEVSHNKIHWFKSVFIKTVHEYHHLGLNYSSCVENIGEQESIGTFRYIRECK